MSGIEELANSRVPLKWLFPVLFYSVSGAGGALAMAFFLGGYQTATQANFDRLQARIEIVEKKADLASADHDLLIAMEVDVRYLANRARARERDAGRDR